MLREHRHPGVPDHSLCGLTTFTPFGKAIPAGKQLPPKNLARMMAEGHPHCYVATTTVGYPVDLMNKTRKGLNRRGAAFMHCYTPCQKGWVYQTSMTVELGRRVVEAGLFPVWEYDPGGADVPLLPPAGPAAGHRLPRHAGPVRAHAAGTHRGHPAGRQPELAGHRAWMCPPSSPGGDQARHARLKEESYSMPLNRGVSAWSPEHNSMADHWQISFDHGHQQRYLPDRRAVLSYVLSIGPRAASPRFEVFVEVRRPRGRTAARPAARIRGPGSST